MSYKIIILIFSAVLFSLFFISCEDKFKPPNSETKLEDSVSQESWNSTVIFSELGNTKAILKAGHISVFKSKGYTQIDSGATVDFFKNGVQVSRLSGQRGRIDDKTKDIEIYDSVIVINNEGSELNTQKLFWENKTQKVSSDVFVTIKTPEETIEGIGFESDQNLKNYKIFKVSGTFSK